MWGCFANGGAALVAAGPRSLGEAIDVVVSPDGKSVYVASFDSNSISRFNATRRPAPSRTRMLRPTGRRRLHVPTHDSLGGADGVAVSGDGKSVYVASYNRTRSAASPQTTTGALTYVDCFANGGAGGCTAPPTTRWRRQQPRRKRRRQGGLRRFGALGLDQPLQPRHDDRRPHLRRLHSQRRRQWLVAPAHDSLDAVGLGASGNGKSVYRRFRFIELDQPLQPQPDDWRLTYKGCSPTAAANGCVAPATTRWEARRHHVSATASRSTSPRSTSNSISRFNRDANHRRPRLQGLLRQWRRGRLCGAPHNSLGEASASPASADGKSVYVASTQGSTRFNRVP